MPAQPAPTTRTSWVASTTLQAIETTAPAAPVRVPPSGLRAGGADRLVHVPEALREVLAEHLRELAGLHVVLLRVAPGRARLEQRVVLDARHVRRHPEAEQVVLAELHIRQLAL